MNIKQKRESLGLTQKELAAKTGLSQAQISQWEIGLRTPSVDQLERLTEILEQFEIGQLLVSYRER